MWLATSLHSSESTEFLIRITCTVEAYVNKLKGTQRTSVLNGECAEKRDRMHTQSDDREK